MSINHTHQQLVEAWIHEQSIRTPLLASRIARDLHNHVDALDVAEVLLQLNLTGKIRRGFAVRVPSGPVLRRIYCSLDDIEPVIQDQLNRSVPRDDLEVLPAFEKVEA